MVIEPEFGLLFDFYYLREFQSGDNSLASVLIHAWYITDEYSIAQWLGSGTLKPDCLSSKVVSDTSLLFALRQILNLFCASLPHLW